MKCLNRKCALLLLMAGVMITISLSAQKKSDVKIADNKVGIGSDKVDGDYIGGLKDDRSPVYSKVVTQKDFTVSDKSSLLKALASAKKGQVVYVADNASIDLTGTQKIPINAGVTLASGRGKNNSQGALLYTKSVGVRPLLLVNGPDVRITGLRIQGSDQRIVPGKNAFAGKSAEERKRDHLKLFKQNMYATKVSSAIDCRFPNLEVDNCELYGWTVAAIWLIKGAQNANIHHNYIHHNQRFGLGYGVVMNLVTALVKGNLFDYNNQSISSHGNEGTSYEVCYNKFLEHHMVAWPIDMHGGADRKDGTNIAGTKLMIHHNLIRLFPNKEGIVIRGVPTVGAYVYNNEIVYLNKPAVGDNTTTDFDGKNVPAAAAPAARSVSFFESRQAAPAATKKTGVDIKTAVKQKNATGKMLIFDNEVKQND